MSNSYFCSSVIEESVLKTLVSKRILPKRFPIVQNVNFILARNFHRRSFWPKSSETNKFRIIILLNEELTISKSLSYQNSIKYWNKCYFSILREKHATKTFNSGERNTLTSDFLKWSSQRSPFKPLDSTTVTWWNLKLIEGSTHHSEKRLVCPDLLSWHVEYPISIQVQLVELSWFITRYEKNISYFRSSEIEIFPNNYLNFNK